MDYLKFHKWNEKDKNTLSKSSRENLGMKEIQFYQPYFSLYFHIHNTKNSHKKIDLERRYIIKKILNTSNEKYHTSNLFVNCQVLDKYSNALTIKKLFCKCVPLLDPLYFMMNNYNNFVHRNPLLPSGFSNNTYQKINDMSNTAYIDTFFSYISSELTLNNINPSFPTFYGSFNGIKSSFNYDISDEYDDYKEECWFHKNLGKTYTIDMYLSDSDNGSDNSDNGSDNSDNGSDNSDNDSDNGSDNGSDNSDNGSDNSDNDSDNESDNDSDNSSNYSSNDDYIASLKDIPSQLFFIELLEGTLEDLLEDFNDLDTKIILSCMFQISFALCYLQKKFNFTHNDLHVNNIMFKKTEKAYLYYKFNNIYFKVPTHGYLFKIIDFGRAIFTFHKKLFFNDTFEKHGEASGQYSVPYSKLLFSNNKEKILPNFNFDLCRLATTILDVCDFNKNKNYHENQNFVDFIYNLTLKNNGESLYDLDDDFDLYISIAKEATNSSPLKIIQHNIFNQYRIKKKNFPKKSFYTL